MSDDAARRCSVDVFLVFLHDLLNVGFIRGGKHVKNSLVRLRFGSR